MKKLFMLLLLAVISCSAFAQTKKYTVPIAASGRVDTTNADVKAVYHLIKNYLESSPDSLYDNPYWNKKETEDMRYPSDFSRALYQYYKDYTAEGVFNYWKPFVLTIEKVNKEKYRARVAFISDTTNYSKILTIIRLNAIYEDDKWVLQNVLSDIEKEWNTKQFKYIKYVFPDTYQFNDSIANIAIQFCDSIAKILDYKTIEPFTFYICKTPDEMGELMGFEFYYLNYTTGMTSVFLGKIFSSKNNEHYPHEFVHMLMKNDTNIKASYMIQEGVCSFLGELNTEKYLKQIKTLAKDVIAKKETYVLDSLLINKAAWNGYQTAYPTGSIITEIVFEIRGYEGIRMLIHEDSSSLENIYKMIKKITKLNKKEFETLFIKKLNAYL